jgi:hypothetical protein
MASDALRPLRLLPPPAARADEARLDLHALPALAHRPGLSALSTDPRPGLPGAREAMGRRRLAAVVAAAAPAGLVAGALAAPGGVAPAGSAQGRAAWQRLHPSLVERSEVAAAVARGRGYVMGGFVAGARDDRRRGALRPAPRPLEPGARHAAGAQPRRGHVLARARLRGRRVPGRAGARDGGAPALRPASRPLGRGWRTCRPRARRSRSGSSGTASTRPAVRRAVPR